MMFQRLSIAAILASAPAFGQSTSVANSAADLRSTLLEVEVEDYLATADPPAEKAEGLLPLPDYSGDWQTRKFLTGDWGGTRSKWASKGVTFDFQWFQAGQGIIDGGVDTGWAYGTNLDYFITLDLMRMKLLSGALVNFRGQSRFGNTVNADTGLLLPANSYSAFPVGSAVDDDIPFTITELNYMQFFSEKFAVLIGKITTMKNANEFSGGEGRTQFMNFQFLYSAVFAQVAPYSTLAAGVFWNPSAQVSVTSILMNTQDASTTTGFSDIGDGTSWWTSLDYQYSARGLPGGGTVGFVYAFNGDFARIGGINFDPEDGPSVAKEKEAWALFWTGWQYVYIKGGAAEAVDPRDGVQDHEGLGLFLGVGIADQSTNPAIFTIKAGLSGRGMIPGRSNDTYGLGYYYNDLQDPRAIALILLKDTTQGLEAYYNVAIARSIALTFDFQWVRSAFSGVDDSIIVAARLNIRF